MSKILFLDLETTGVKHWENGIHQMSGYVDIDGIIQDTFNFKVKPHPSAKIEESALKIAGVTLEQVMAYPSMQEVKTKLTAILSKYVDKYSKQDKFHIAGYNNAGFDNPFFRGFFEQTGDKYFGSWFWSDSLDAMVLASQHLKDVRQTMVDFKLATVAQQLGIEIDESRLHDAMYDVELTRQIYYIVTNKA